MNNYKASEFAADALRILEPSELCFSRSDSGYLNLTLDGREYEQVSLIRLQPFYEHDEHISVSFRNEDEEWIEIGVIRDIKELSAEQREIADSYLSFRYYVPLVTKVHSITDNRMGYLFIEAETTSGKKRIAVNDWWSNFRMNSSGMLTITDADGNKYYIPELEKLDKKSIRKIELFI